MRAIKTMLFGIALITFGLFGIQTETWLAGVGVFLPFLGLLLCIIGLFIKGNDGNGQNGQDKP